MGCDCNCHKLYPELSGCCFLCEHRHDPMANVMPVVEAAIDFIEATFKNRGIEACYAVMSNKVKRYLDWKLMTRKP